MLVLHKLVPGVFSILLCVGFVFGQATSGTISGTITDERGAVVPGAAVLIKNTETGLERRVESNESGYYHIVGLSPGNYELRVERQGFKPELRSGLKLTVAQDSVVDFQLNVGSLQEAVQVSDSGAQVESTNATLNSLVDERKIRDLPLNGRDMAQLILLQPVSLIAVQALNRPIPGAARCSPFLAPVQVRTFFNSTGRRLTTP